MMYIYANRQNWNIGTVQGRFFFSTAVFLPITLILDVF